ncbi:hypothetical protein ACM43_17805 [Bradyrhizobium sp. CCBAU 45321]|nr:hypothetical protein [Bradyrhizobium sp. CCBAU 45321]
MSGLLELASVSRPASPRWREEHLKTREGSGERYRDSISGRVFPVSGLVAAARAHASFFETALTRLLRMRLIGVSAR